MEEGMSVERRKGLSSQEAAARLEEFGYNELPEKKRNVCFEFLAYFWGPMPLMIWVAMLLEFAQAITATVKRDGRFMNIPARELVPGKPMQVDRSALTGESLAATVRPGDTVEMGCTIERGELEAIVENTGVNTFFGRTAMMYVLFFFKFDFFFLVSFQMVLFRVMLFLMAIACFLVAKVVLQSVGVAVVILVASIPIAMQVVATVTMAVGASLLAKEKAIVARLSAIEELAGMEILCSDKTGTLTINKLTLDDPIVIDERTSESFTLEPEHIIFYAALAAKRIEGAGQDAIDFFELPNGIGSRSLRDFEELDFLPFDPLLKRTEATVGLVGAPFKVTKGAAPVIIDMCVNGAEMKSEVLQVVDNLAGNGYRALAKDLSDGAWKFIGILSLFDPPRSDTKRTIELATEMQVEVKMITGDHGAIAKETAKRLSMGLSKAAEMNNVPPAMQELVISANGFAEVLPEDKFNIVKVLMDRGYTVGMTGDGVNDAPALKRAQIGIAVEGATDAARAAADIVLTEPGLSTIIKAMVLSRKIFQRVRNYCIFRIAGTIQLIFFFFIAVNFKPKQYFHLNNVYLPVIAIVLITLLNDACVLTIARDNVVPSPKPQQWDLVEVFVSASVLGAVACIGSTLILIIGLHAGNTDRWNRKCVIQYDQLLTVLYLKLSLTDFITVFAARTRNFFFSRAPAVALSGAFVVATGSTSFIAGNAKLGKLMSPIPIGMIVMTWIFSIICFLVQDIVKVMTYKCLDCMRGKTQNNLEEVLCNDSQNRRVTDLERQVSFQRNATNNTDETKYSILPN
eukprot:GSMAST32.ASY1.ANO1.823.1 assembled CDS